MNDLIGLSPVELQVDSILGKESNQIEENANSSLFESIVDGVTDMKETQIDSKLQMADVLMGNSDNAHGAMIALQNAELQLSFFASAREKTTQGFNQLFNMQI